MPAPWALDGCWDLLLQKLLGRTAGAHGDPGAQPPGEESASVTFAFALNTWQRVTVTSLRSCLVGNAQASEAGTAPPRPWRPPG